MFCTRDLGILMMGDTGTRLEENPTGKISSWGCPPRDKNGGRALRGNHGYVQEFK